MAGGPLLAGVRAVQDVASAPFRDRLVADEALGLWPHRLPEDPGDDELELVPVAVLAAGVAAIAGIGALAL